MQPLSNFPTQSSKANCFHKSWGSLSSPFESLYQAWTRSGQAQLSRKTCLSRTAPWKQCLPNQGSQSHQGNTLVTLETCPILLPPRKQTKTELYLMRLEAFNPVICGTRGCMKVAEQLPAQSSYELGSHGWRQYTSWEATGKHKHRHLLLTEALKGLECGTPPPFPGSSFKGWWLVLLF